MLIFKTNYQHCLPLIDKDFLLKLFLAFRDYLELINASNSVGNARRVTLMTDRALPSLKPRSQNCLTDRVSKIRFFSEKVETRIIGYTVIQSF